MNFSTRWRDDQVLKVLSEVSKGQTPMSPFGTTDDGRADLRGLILNEPLVIRGGLVENCDFSYGRLLKLLCIQSRFFNCSFDEAKISLLNNGSDFEAISFRGADLSLSGSAGPAKFSNCLFEGSKLINCNFQSGQFIQCDFSRCAIERVDFGQVEIFDSKFEGSIEKCFFRGAISGSDFCKANFIDCAFYGAELNRCKFSDDVILFKGWNRRSKKICASAEGMFMSPGGRASLERWCRVWEQLNDVMCDEVIDFKSLLRQEEGTVAEELFNFFRLMAERYGNEGQGI